MSETPKEVEQMNPFTPAPRIAPWYKRLAAGFIDTVIVMLLTLPFTLLLSDAYSYQQRAALPSMLIMMGYFYYFHRSSGQTPGKRLLRIKVVTANSSQPLQLGLRETLGRFISSAFFNLGYLWILIDGKRQGWHDKIGNTIVIEVKT